MKSAAAPPSLWFIGIAALVGNVLCWGATPVILRQLTGSLDAWMANAIRYPMAALMYWPILFVAWRRGLLGWKLVGRCLVPALFSLGGQVFWALAPYYLEASAIGFYVRMSLVWAITASMILFPDERQLLARAGFYAGLAMMITGFIFMSRDQWNGMTVVSTTGVVMMIFCSVFFGFYGVSVRYFLSGTHPLLAFGVVCQLVSIGTLSLAVIGQPQPVLYLDATAWTLLVVASILGIALGHVFLYTAVQRLGASIASAAQMVTPLTTVLIAAVVLGEKMGVTQWLGGLTMLIGAAVLLRTEHEKRKLSAEC
jgi:drug/metabolite transporter (DMT)-like permease